MEKRMKPYQCLTAAAVVLAGVMFLNPQVAAQILRIGEMNTQQIHALDLPKTVVLIPGGILEEHGPYLPSYTDGYADDAYTRELAKAIVARPGWTVVLFPQIPLGNDPANTIGGKTIFPGSYPVRNGDALLRSYIAMPDAELRAKRTIVRYLFVKVAHFLLDQINCRLL